MARAMKGVSSPPVARPRRGASARRARPRSIRNSDRRMARRSPSRSALPPKNSMLRVMPEVSVPTIQPACRSVSPAYSLKYMAR